MAAIKKVTTSILSWGTLLALILSSPGANASDLESTTFRLTQSTATHVLWTTPATERVFKDGAAPTETGSEIKAYAARNEFEPFVVAIRPTVSGNVTITLDNFGDGITAECHLVDYVNIATTTDVLGRTGDYPDPLWPIANGASVALTAGQTSAFWCTLYVPSGAAAGDHVTNLHIGSITVPVRLHVFAFQIPETPGVFSQMNLNQNLILQRYGVSGTGANYWSYVDAIKRFMIDHRLTPSGPLWPGGVTSGGEPFIDYDCATAQITDTDGIWGFEKPAERWLGGGGLMNGTFSQPFNNGGGFPPFMAATFKTNDPSTDQRPDTFCGVSRGGVWSASSSAYNAKWFAYMTALQDYLDGLGYLDDAYYYMANEPQDQADYDAIAWYAQRLKQAAPGLKLMVSEQPRPEIYAHPSYPDAKIDIWLPVLQALEPAVSSARETGYQEATWIYFLHSTRPPLLNPITLDHPGVESRLTAWLLWKYRLRGLAYYSINGWSANPWTSPMNLGQNGNLFLFYPPSKTNANIAYGANGHRFVPSIRLELLREGLEDWEYLKLLAGGRPEWGVSTGADTQVDKIVTGLTSYTRDGGFIANLRRLIGLKLSGEAATIPDIQPPARHPRATGLPGKYYLNFQNPTGSPTTTRIDGAYRYVTVNGREYFQIGTDAYNDAKGYGWYAPPDIHWQTAYATNCATSSEIQKSRVYSDYGRRATFEFALPNGTYNVALSVGWCCRSYSDKQEVRVEGVTLFENAVLSDCVTRTAQITVSDSSLSLEMGDESNDQYTFLNYLEIEAATVADPEPGDLDCNGGIDLRDAVGVLRILAGHTGVAPAACPPLTGDLDEDGLTTLADAIGLLRRVAELP